MISSVSCLPVRRVLGQMMMRLKLADQTQRTECQLLGYKEDNGVDVPE